MDLTPTTWPPIRSATAWRRTAYRAARGSLRSWLFGIAVNLLRNHWRAEQRLLERDAELASRAAVPAPDAASGDLEPRLTAALARLNRGQREVLLLHAWADLGNDEIAAALRIPQGTVSAPAAAGRRIRARRQTRASRSARRQRGEERSCVTRSNCSRHSGPTRPPRPRRPGPARKRRSTPPGTRQGALSAAFALAAAVLVAVTLAAGTTASQGKTAGPARARPAPRRGPWRADPCPRAGSWTPTAPFPAR